MLPFANTVATFGLKGSDMTAALENAVSRAENTENEGTGRFAQVSGVRFKWDPTKPAGSRVSEIEVGSRATGYQVLEPDAIYQVAANDFMRSGGDGYTVLAEKAIDPYDCGSLLADAVTDFIQAHSPISVTVEGRIARIQ